MKHATLNYKVEPVGAWRLRVIVAVLGVAAMAVLGRAFQLQVLQRDFLAREGERRHVRTVALEAHRGAIRDRRGESLALSAPVDSIWTVPQALLSSPEHVRALAQVLEIKESSLNRFLKGRAGRQFVYLRRQMSPADAERVLALKAPGVFAQREYRRFYPAGEVAGQVVGFTDIDGRGQEGMEAARDDFLRGRPGSRRVIRDARGRIVEDSADAVPALAGHDLKLTIDLRLQYLAYRELKAAVAASKAKGGLVVVADAQSGEILAIASQPGSNPNNMEDRSSGGQRNRAITDSFEPGSTVKPLLAAQAIELHRFSPSSTFDTGRGWLKVGRLTVRDTHANGVIDLSTVLAKSSNVGASIIGLNLGAANVYAGYQRFGLGEPVHSGFPGEALPLLRPPSQWGEIATATASYGYGLSVNALTMVRAYCGLANDGLMPQLSLVGDAPKPPPQRAVSPETARAVRKMLQKTIEKGGTATRAAISGYRVAGKTGTVHKVSEAGGYSAKRYQSAFIGMVPAEHPRLVGLVMIDEPSVTGYGSYYGGVVSAPVFSKVMQGALRLLQIAPEGPLAPAAPVLAMAGGAP